VCCYERTRQVEATCAAQPRRIDLTPRSSADTKHNTHTHTQHSNTRVHTPIQDPLAIIGILAIFFPFVLLLLAIATGYIDLSVYK
jgi:hypothetical protein